MNLLQIYDQEGEEYGLFTAQTDKDQQPIIDTCWEKALKKEENEEADNCYDVFEELLEEQGIERIFVEEYNIN